MQASGLLILLSWTRRSGFRTLSTENQSPMGAVSWEQFCFSRSNWVFDQQKDRRPDTYDGLQDISMHFFQVTLDNSTVNVRDSSIVSRETRSWISWPSQKSWGGITHGWRRRVWPTQRRYCPRDIPQNKLHETAASLHVLLLVRSGKKNLTEQNCTGTFFFKYLFLIHTYRWLCHALCTEVACAIGDTLISRHLDTSLKSYWPDDMTEAMPTEWGLQVWQFNHDKCAMMWTRAARLGLWTAGSGMWP